MDITTCSSPTASSSTCKFPIVGNHYESIPQLSNSTVLLNIGTKENPRFIPTIERFTSKSSEEGMITSKTTIYACMLCNGRFGSLEKFRLHDMEHNHDYECNRCGLLLSNLRDYNEHENICFKKDEHHTFPCKNCGKSFTSHKLMRAHERVGSCLNTHHECNCGRVFSNSRSLINHSRKCKFNVASETGRQAGVTLDLEQSNGDPS